MVQPRIHTRSLVGLACAALVLCCACASTPEEKTGDTPNPIQVQDPEPIGKFLADFDKSVAQWSSLTLTASTSTEYREARVLESVLVESTTRRGDELIKELESGPPINRIRAAAALGFTRSVEAQSPLLAALSDSNPDVVHNALLGLAVLGRGDTPLDGSAICSSAAPTHRRAARPRAMRSIVGAGGTSDKVVGIARRALVDTEPFVRVQCALTSACSPTRTRFPRSATRSTTRCSWSARRGESLVLIAKKISARRAIGRKFVEALTKGDARLQKRAKEELVQIPTSITAMTSSSDRMGRAAVA